MSTVLVQIMDYQKGHEEKKFDSTKPKQLKEMIEFILQKIESGMILYAGIRGQDFKKLADRSKANSYEAVQDILLKNESFMMKEDVGLKLLVAPQPMGG